MARDQRTMLFIGGGLALGAIGLLVAASATDAGQSAARSARQLGEEALDYVKDWIATLLVKTASHEGYYWSVQRNNDGQGVSYGILQWTQAGGGLYSVLTTMRAEDPVAFDAAFDGTTNALAVIVHCQGLSLAPLMGANLWDEPWLGRFRRAGGPIPSPSPKRLPMPTTRLQAAQIRAASGGVHMRAAIANARALDVATERGMVLCFNRSVHQGEGGSTGPRRDLLALWAAKPTTRPASVNNRLAQYAWMCADGFRRTTPPQGRTLSNGFVAYGKSDSIWWQPVGEEWSELRQDDYTIRRVSVSGVWHAVGGLGSLYDMIVRRSSDILLDKSLRDNPVDLTEAVS